MNIDKLKIFTLGYSDNTSTSFILNYFFKQGVVIDGIILCESQVKMSWKRILKKIQMRGFISAFIRIIENLFVKKRQISKICQQHKEIVFKVNKINSEQVRDIFITNSVDLLILTSTPIIKPIILNIPGLTILNAHTGCLPQYRGLDANFKALRDGSQLGVSIHKVTEKLDAGEVYLRENFEIKSRRNIVKQIDRKELELSGKLFVEAINLLRIDKLEPIAQEEPLGVYEPPLTRKERNKIIRKYINQ